MKISDRAGNKSIHFRQWSREKYAMFASLGKIIKISHISAEISDSSLRKSVPKAVISNEFSALNPEEAPDSNDLTVTKLQAELLIPIVSQNSECSSQRRMPSKKVPEIRDLKNPFKVHFNE